MTSARSAAKGAQQLLIGAGARIAADGIWGAKSSNAFTKAPGTVQKTVVQNVTAAGIDFARLGALTGGMLEGRWVSQDDVDSFAAKAAANSSISADLIRAFVRLEAAQKVSDGARYYNAASVAPNGLYHGLMQMGRPAWSDVNRAYPGSPSFEEARYDGEQNVLAGARYASLNKSYLRKMGFRGEFTLQTMYAAHNQGAAGFMGLLRNPRPTKNFQNQSAEARAVIKTALAQSGVSMA